jgi:hypothetical protein
MEINLGTKGFGTVGMMSDVTGAADVKSAGQKEAASAKIEVKSAPLDALKQSEPVAEVPESALSRDDELGRLVSTAFCLPAPPMPEFAT